MARNYTHEAGVWEQNRYFVPVSRHETREAAKRAAVRYARQQTQPTGGALSWAGGVREIESDHVTWYKKNGEIW